MRTNLVVACLRCARRLSASAAKCPACGVAELAPVTSPGARAAAAASKKDRRAKRAKTVLFTLLVLWFGTSLAAGVLSIVSLVFSRAPSGLFAALGVVTGLVGYLLGFLLFGLAIALPVVTVTFVALGLGALAARGEEGAFRLPRTALGALPRRPSAARRALAGFLGWGALLDADALEKRMRRGIVVAFGLSVAGAVVEALVRAPNLLEGAMLVLTTAVGGGLIAAFFVPLLGALHKLTSALWRYVNASPTPLSLAPLGDGDAVLSPELLSGPEGPLVGRIEAAAGELLEAPCSGERCIGFRVSGSVGGQAFDDAALTPFVLLTDAGDRYLVTGEDALLALPLPDRARGASGSRDGGSFPWAGRAFLEARGISLAHRRGVLETPTREALLRVGDEVLVHAARTSELAQVGRDFRASASVRIARAREGQPIAIERRRPEVGPRAGAALRIAPGDPREAPGGRGEPAARAPEAAADVEAKAEAEAEAEAEADVERPRRGRRRRGA